LFPSLFKYISQAAVKFASAYNLRLAVKASGHDYLGRSTAPNSLLIRTSHFQNIAFTDAFYVGTQNLGSAVTVGSGVHLQDLYAQAKNQGKVVVGGSAATVVAAGGYLQGGGHSALAPLFGLAADNVLGKVSTALHHILLTRCQNSTLLSRAAPCSR
jgi:FAD/FMN-containing dehydrogenase